MFDYYSKIEYYIKKFYQDGVIEFDKTYYMIDDNKDKTYAFSVEKGERIRFRYEKEVCDDLLQKSHL